VWVGVLQETVGHVLQRGFEVGWAYAPHPHKKNILMTVCAHGPSCPSRLERRVSSTSRAWWPLLNTDALTLAVCTGDGLGLRHGLSRPRRRPHVSPL
jgi:hypothetical protein